MKHAILSFLLLLGLSVFAQNSGEELYRAKKYKESAAAFKSELEQTPDDYKLQLGYANALHKQEFFSKAVEQYNIAEKLNNSDPELYFDRGVALVFLNLHKKALKDFDQSLKLNETNPEAHYYKGFCNYELSRYRASIESYNEAVELRPDYAAAIYNIGAVKAELQNFEGGTEDFELALSKDPELKNGRMNIALSKLAQNKFEESIKDFDMIIDSRDENLDKAYLYRGEAYYELKNKVKACSDWAKAANLDNEKATSNIKDFCGSKTKPRKKIDIAF